MKTETLDVGVKLPVAFKVTVNLQIPETSAECLKLAKSEPYFVEKFVRAWRIDNQEASGARDLVAAFGEARMRKAQADPAEMAKCTAETQTVVDGFNPSAPPARRGAPAKPVTVDPAVVAKALKGNKEAIETLKAQGIILTLQA